MTTKARTAWLAQVRATAEAAMVDLESDPEVTQSEAVSVNTVPALLAEIKRLEKELGEFAAAIVAAEGNEGCGCCSDPACSFCGEPGIPGKITHKPDCVFLKAKAVAP